MPNQECKVNNCKNGILMMETRASKFIKFQEIKLQELSSQVPMGHIPRTISIQMHGELTRKCSPGDIVTVNAIFLPEANQGFKAIRFGLVADTFLLGQSLKQQKKSYSNFKQSNTTSSSSSFFTYSNDSEELSYTAFFDLPFETQAMIKSFLESDDVSSRYERLAKSIAPEIFGLEDVKKSLLLQMVGGVTHKMEDGMRIRGDINICLMGDPGVAKSQLLKHISTIAPRAVYTSGKGSTGVGLTAAVLRDPNTKEFVLEGGSLTMADMGICCIDEFDKMDDTDRTAIHEVMEQQTISIAKAGITTTLNARTAVLAAANPAWGRYNIRRSPSENINLPASLLSRFDLLFLLLDKADSVKDRALAKHITYVHRFSSHPPLGFDPLSPELMRAFIGIAKTYHPHVPENLSEYIVSSYCSLREEKDSVGEEFSYITARTLLAILRLSQALARLRFDYSICKEDIQEAIRLMSNSKDTLIEEKHKPKRIDQTSAVYNIIRNYAQQKDTNQISYEEIIPVVLLKGYSQDLLDTVLDTYDSLGGVWTVSANRRIITLI